MESVLGKLLQFFTALSPEAAARYALPKKPEPEARPNPFPKDDYTYEPIDPNASPGPQISY